MSLTTFPLTPPGGLSPEVWLQKYDSAPSALPRWPESRKMTLVAVGGEQRHGRVPKLTAYAVTAQDDLAELLRDESSAIYLFFVVPRSVVLADGVRSPALTAASWQD